MNHRERTLAILNYQPYDRLPLIHFGFWEETLDKWAQEGHITAEDALAWGDGNAADRHIGGLLGFDGNWSLAIGAETRLDPPFEQRVLEELPDGGRKVLDEHGAVILQKPGVRSIPQEFDHLLKDRKSWEELYKPRLQWNPERINRALRRLLTEAGEALEQPLPEISPEQIGPAERDMLLEAARQRGMLMGVWCGSLYGDIRDNLGLVGLSYLTVDDPALLEEMIETQGELCYQGVKATLDAGLILDFGHFWEDICYRAGPLVNPKFFKAKVGPHYRRITELLNAHGIHIVSLDCDGKIDALIPTWLENGVNTMFPIEVGVWNASIKPWREKYGPELLGIGGMDKRVFAYDYTAIDAEVERLRPLVDLGGYIPCPDHRIPPNAKWENVQYYCDRMRSVFG
jgi:hypothetical protein